MKLSLKIKLVLTGIILLLVPLGALTIISVFQTTHALQEMAREEMMKRTSEIADSINNVLSSEEKFIQGVALNSIISTAFSPDGDGRVLTDGERFAGLNRELDILKNEPLTGGDYQVILAADAEGIVRAASDPEYIGVDLSDRQYIRTALAGRVNIGQAARNKVTDEPFIPVAAPVKDAGGRITGVAASIMDLDFLWELIKDSTRGETGYTYVTDAYALILAHPDPSTLFTLDISKLEGMGDIVANFKNGKSGYEHYIYNGERKTAGFDVVKNTGWGVFITQVESDFLSASNAIRNLMLIVSGVAFIIAFTVFFIFAGTITSPIKRVVVFAGEISRGLLYTDINVRQKDEIGEMASALKSMQEKLREVISNVIESSEQVSSGSRQLAMSAVQLSEGATEQAANAEEVSSSVEQMGANIMQNTDNSAKTEEIASQAAVDIENGGTAVLEAVESMNEIAEKIGIIEEIARNTNLLSLNAAIEAARAGEHGKGFAVVASEVGKLAATSQKAALEIQDLARRSVEKSNNAGEKIRKIVPDIRKTAELVAEISASSHEQSSGAEQINSAMIQLDNVIQQNASASEEVSSMSEELSSQAENLLDTTRFFRLSREQFMVERQIEG